MENTVVQSNYFPCVDYFRLLAGTDQVLVEIQDHFVKQTYRNRCEIYGANGKLPLTVPIYGRNTRQKMHAVQISYQENWPAKHWQAIVSSYRSAPFFDYFEDDIKALLFARPETLEILNRNILHYLLEKCRLKPQVAFTTDFCEVYPAPFTDHRESFHPRQSFTGEQVPYRQVFSDRHGFLPNLSMLDLLCNQYHRLQEWI